MPDSPFTGIRLYMESWEIEARAAGDDSVTRELLYAGPGSAP